VSNIVSVKSVSSSKSEDSVKIEDSGVINYNEEMLKEEIRKKKEEENKNNLKNIENSDNIKKSEMVNFPQEDSSLDRNSEDLNHEIKSDPYVSYSSRQRKSGEHNSSNAIDHNQNDKDNIESNKRDDMGFTQHLAKSIENIESKTHQNEDEKVLDNKIIKNLQIKSPEMKQGEIHKENMNKFHNQE